MSEIGEIKTAIDLMDSMIRSGEDHSERSLAILTEARKQLDALTTGSCDMSEEFRVKQRWSLEAVLHSLRHGQELALAGRHLLLAVSIRAVRSRSARGYKCYEGGLCSRYGARP